MMSSGLCCLRCDVEMCRYMGKEAVRFVNRLRDIRERRIPRDVYVRWVVHLLSVTVQRGHAEMYRRSGLVISRQHGLRYDAGLSSTSVDVKMVHEYWPLSVARFSLWCLQVCRYYVIVMHGCSAPCMPSPSPPPPPPCTPPHLAFRGFGCGALPVWGGVPCSSAFCYMHAFGLFDA